jgi:hypothetical protein
MGAKVLSDEEKRILHIIRKFHKIFEKEKLSFYIKRTTRKRVLKKEI